MNETEAIPNYTFIRGLYRKCKMHGSGGAQVILSDGELFALIALATHDLGWPIVDIDIDIDIDIESPAFPAADYYQIPLAWFETQSSKSIDSATVIRSLSACFEKNNDFGLFLENLSAVHRRRVKYRRILSSQPLPNMDQVGPRSLLEFGECDPDLLANWMLWRKWIYDIDNRAAQEAGYLFEPLLANCLGGEAVDARNSPVKRLGADGLPLSKGRQVDCLVPDNNRVYEFKLRVTIAASGQGRFGEELSFPAEAQAAGYIPVLLVLDPTPSDRLQELAEKFLVCGGAVYHGEAAWKHISEEAGEVVSVFIQKYIRPVIQSMEEIEISKLRSINLEWLENAVEISAGEMSYKVSRLP